MHFFLYFIIYSSLLQQQFVPWYREKILLSDVTRKKHIRNFVFSQIKENCVSELQGTKSSCNNFVI
jgi:hypothetical protein